MNRYDLWDKTKRFFEARSTLPISFLFLASRGIYNYLHRLGVLCSCFRSNDLPRTRLVEIVQYMGRLIEPVLSLSVTW